MAGGAARPRRGDKRGGAGSREGRGEGGGRLARRVAGSLGAPGCLSGEVVVAVTGPARPNRGG